MLVHGYHLQSQLSAGPDGASYFAESQRSGRPAHVLVLSQARFSPDRWKLIVQRTRLLQWLESPTLQKPIATLLDQEIPAIVLPWDGTTRLTDLSASRSVNPTETFKIGRQLAEGLADLHRLGLCFGALCPSAITVRTNGTIRLDPTGTYCDWPAPITRTDVDRLCISPEQERHGLHPTGDTYALGIIIPK